VAVGHGAGELLRAVLRMVARDGEVIVAWPGWGQLPRLVSEAGATPIPATIADIAAAAPGADGGGPADARHERGAGGGGAADSRRAAGPRAGRARAVVLCRPADPTGAVVPLADLAGLAGDAWLILDEALAGFLPGGEDALLDHPRAIHVRSFSKAHAMAGFRVGYAIVPEGVAAEPLEPVHGVGAPALAGALWAVENGAPFVAARRAAAARERERLAAGPFAVEPGHGPYAWMRTAGIRLAEELAAGRVFVAPGSAWGDDAHVRVTLRDPASTGVLLEALEDIARRR
jgi:histidinol-phosphate aminotransferase